MEKESNLSRFPNFTLDRAEYNETLEDLKLREYIKTLMTIGEARLTEIVSVILTLTS